MLEQDVLSLDGIHYKLPDGKSIKFSFTKISVSEGVPLGIKYSLTLHDINNVRILGFDNKHSPKITRKSFKSRQRNFDHKHRYPEDAGIEYDFVDFPTLIEDFYNEVERYLKK